MEEIEKEYDDFLKAHLNYFDGRKQFLTDLVKKGEFEDMAGVPIAWRQEIIDIKKEIKQQNQQPKKVGRPKSNKKKYLISCLPEHIELIREYVKSLNK